MMRFTSKRAGFFNKHEALMDMIKGHMAQDIEVAIKTTAGTPVSATKAMGNKRGGGGHMKSETRHFKGADGGWRVEVDKAYAAYQERGARADGTRRVKNYSTPGTSAGWFKRAIDGVVRNKDGYIMEARRAIGL